MPQTLLHRPEGQRGRALVVALAIVALLLAATVGVLVVQGARERERLSEEARLAREAAAREREQAARWRAERDRLEAERQAGEAERAAALARIRVAEEEEARRAAGWAEREEREKERVAREEEQAAKAESAPAPEEAARAGAAPAQGEAAKAARAPAEQGSPPDERTAGGAYAGRLGGRDVALRKAGGSAATEAAVAAALRWLARHQSADGAWHAQQFSQGCAPGWPCSGPGYDQFDVGLTGLALLAFLGAGVTPFSSESWDDPWTKRTVASGDCVARAAAYLLGVQDGEGCFGVRTGEFMYNHAIAAEALAELYGMTGAPRYEGPARRGTDFLAAAQNPYRGWRYSVKPGDNDTSVTTWCALALRAARVAGIEVSDASRAGVRAWVESVTDDDGVVGYNGKGKTDVVVRGKNEQWGPQPTMCACGILALLVAGGGGPKLQAMAAPLVKDPPVWAEPAVGKPVDSYYWHHGANALFQLDGPGGKRWGPWNDALKKALLPHQVGRAGGCAEGSWPAEADRWGFAGGRVFTTAINALTLETYYRHDRSLATGRPAAPESKEERAAAEEERSARAAVESWLAKRRSMSCSQCAGRGDATCGACGGSGRRITIAVGPGGSSSVAACGPCKGTGRAACEPCIGTGVSTFRLKDVLVRALPPAAQREVEERFGGVRLLEYLLARKFGRFEAMPTPGLETARLADRLCVAWSDWIAPIKSSGPVEVALDDLDLGAAGKVRRASARYALGPGFEERTAWLFVEGAWRLAPPPELPIR